MYKKSLTKGEKTDTKEESQRAFQSLSANGNSFSVMFYFPFYTLWRIHYAPHS